MSNGSLVLDADYTFFQSGKTAMRLLIVAAIMMGSVLTDLGIGAQAAPLPPVEPDQTGFSIEGLPASPQPTEPARPKPIVIAGDNGGVLQVYYERYQTYVAAGATFRIDGRCRSACTLVLAWADRVCVTERAALGFHEVRDKSGQRVQSESDRLMSLYPAPVREYISAHGGLPPPWGTMWVSGSALRGLVSWP
jgi:hypothetical protein